jgi:6-phosphofructokinase 1
VFLIETMGGYCGYLATLSALASGADNAYIFEEPFTINDIKADVNVIASKMEKGIQRYLVVRCEGANANYNADFIQRLYEEESSGKVSAHCPSATHARTHSQFTTRINNLGHVQQGGSPSPFDRNMATKMAARAAEKMVEQMVAGDDGKGHVTVNKPDTCQLLAVDGRAVVFKPVDSLRADTDYAHRLPREQWWLKLRPLLRILAHHDSGVYQNDAVLVKDVDS